MTAPPDRISGQGQKVALASIAKPRAVSHALAVAVVSFICIVAVPATTRANDVVFADCDSASVNLRDGLVTVEICWPEGGDDEAAYYLRHAVDALPHMEELLGFSPVDTSLRIELGHDHSDTLVNTVSIGRCLAPRCSLEVNLWLLLHELTHTFLPSWMSTSWFAEATANITGVVVRAQLGVGEFALPRDAVQERVLDSEQRAIEAGWLDADSAALTLLSELDPHPDSGVGDDYLIGSVVGDVFLGKTYLLLGHDLFSRAYASLARQNPTVQNPLTNEGIRDAFLDPRSGLNCAYLELVWLYLDRSDAVDCTLDPDAYEANDSFNEAPSIGPGRYSLSLHEASDRDYFAIAVPAGHTLTVSLSSLLNRRVEAALYDSDRNPLADFDADEGGTITANYTTAHPGLFFLEIFSEQGSILRYDLRVSIYGAYKFSLGEDNYEQNDTLNSSTAVAEGAHHELSIDTQGDDDWYHIDVPPNHWLEVEMSNIRQYAVLDASITNSIGRLLAGAKPEGDVKTARTFVQPCAAADQRLYIHVTGNLGKYARYISEYDLGIRLVREGFDSQRLCALASLLAETDQSNVFNLFAIYPGKLQFAPCLTCSFQDDIDKGMRIRVLVKQESGKPALIGPIPTLIPFNKGASRLASFAQQLNKLNKEWIPSVLFNGQTPDF